MLLKSYNFIIINTILLITKSKSESLKKCSYDYTVDLTPAVELQNNSYLLDNGALIPPDLVKDYDYEILNSGTRIDVSPYKRGCICAIVNCIRFCTNDPIEFYANYSSPEIDRGFTKNVTLNNGETVERHVIHDFYPIFGMSCVHENSEMLAPEMFPENEWTLYEDGTLQRYHDNINLTQNEYCFDINTDEETNTLQFLNPVICKTPRREIPWIHKYGFICSIPFFVIIILCYCILSKPCNFRGKCFITYLSFLTSSYTLISFFRIYGLQLTDIPCQIYGYVIYYFTIGYFTWNCILGYDAWKTLTHMVNEESTYWKYSIFGFTIPLLSSLVAFAINTSTTNTSIHWNCVVITTSPLASLIFYDVCGLIAFLNTLTLYIMILRYSWKTKKESIRLFCETQEPQMERLKVYIRIFLLMGFEWIFITILHILRILYSKETQIVNMTLYAAGLITTVQGLCMFLIFIFTPRVICKIREIFRRLTSSTRVKRSTNCSTNCFTTEEMRHCAPIFKESTL